MLLVAVVWKLLAHVGSGVVLDVDVDVDAVKVVDVCVLLVVGVIIVVVGVVTHRSSNMYVDVPGNTRRSVSADELPVRQVNDSLV